MSSPKAPKIQPWKTVWPPAEAEGRTPTPCNRKVDYGAKQGDIVILDGSGFMLKPFDAYRKPVLKRGTDVARPIQQ